MWAEDTMFSVWYTLTVLMTTLFSVLVPYWNTYFTKIPDTRVVDLNINCQKWMICTSAAYLSNST